MRALTLTLTLTLALTLTLTLTLALALAPNLVVGLDADRANPNLTLP
jgi:hypothetical protein